MTRCASHVELDKQTTELEVLVKDQGLPLGDRRVRRQQRRVRALISRMMSVGHSAGYFCPDENEHE